MTVKHRVIAGKDIWLVLRGRRTLSKHRTPYSATVWIEIFKEMKMKAICIVFGLACMASCATRPIGVGSVGQAITTPSALSDPRIQAMTLGSLSPDARVFVLLDPEPDAGTLPLDSGASVAGLSARYVFPASDPWYQRVDTLPVHSMSATWTNPFRGAIARVEWGAKPWQGIIGGIPLNIIGPDQPFVPVRTLNIEGWELGQTDCSECSLPIPLDAAREGGPATTETDDEDRHIVVYDPTRSRTYELWRASRIMLDGAQIGWSAQHVSIWDSSRVTPQRPIGKTSADAAGLPIAPALFTYDDVQAAMQRPLADRHLGHALRITLPAGWIRKAFVKPSTIPGKSSNVSSEKRIPYGGRMRLRAGWSIDANAPAWVRAEVKSGRWDRRYGEVITQTLKFYGAIVADIGMTLAIVGCPDQRWSDTQSAGWLEGIRGSDFEVVDSGPIYTAATMATAASAWGLTVSK